MSEKNKNRPLIFEVWGLLKERKAWWLTPIVVMLILVGAIIIFGQSSPISPFIYTMF
jgi:hypothetical protein